MKKEILEFWGGKLTMFSALLEHCPENVDKELLYKEFLEFFELVKKDNKSWWQKIKKRLRIK